MSGSQVNKSSGPAQGSGVISGDKVCGRSWEGGGERDCGQETNGKELSNGVHGE